MCVRDSQDEILNVKEINVASFIKGLPLSLEDRKTLLLCIAAIQKETGESTARLTTAACMGLSEDDPMFNAFYNKDVAPIVSLDIQKLYNQLSSLLSDEEEEKHAENAES